MSTQTRSSKRRDLSPAPLAGSLPVLGSSLVAWPFHAFHQTHGRRKLRIFELVHSFRSAVKMLRRGSGGLLSLGSWQAPRFYVYEAGELTGAPKALLYIKESAWGPSATQVGPAPVFLGKYLELQATQANQFPLRGRKTIELGSG